MHRFIGWTLALTCCVGMLGCPPKDAGSTSTRDDAGDGPTGGVTGGYTPGMNDSNPGMNNSTPGMTNSTPGDAMNGATPGHGWSAEQIPCGVAACLISPVPIAGLEPSVGCCVDEGNSLCGFIAMDGACTPYVNPDPDCGKFQGNSGASELSCCAANGYCGVIANTWGGLGCVDFETARSGPLAMHWMHIPEVPRSCAPDDDGGT